MPNVVDVFAIGDTVELKYHAAEPFFRGRRYVQVFGTVAAVKDPEEYKPGPRCGGWHGGKRGIRSTCALAEYDGCLCALKYQHCFPHHEVVVRFSKDAARFADLPEEIVVLSTDIVKVVT